MAGAISVYEPPQPGRAALLMSRSGSNDSHFYWGRGQQILTVARRKPHAAQAFRIRSAGRQIARRCPGARPGRSHRRVGV